MTQVNTETAFQNENLDRRLEVIDATMGWSAHEVRMMAEGLPPEEAQADAAVRVHTKRPHTTRKLGGRAVNQGDESEHDPFMNGTIQPTPEEIEATAPPDSEDRERGEAWLTAVDKQAIARRAIANGQAHQLPALYMTRLVRRAQRLGISVEELQAREKALEDKFKQ